MIGKFFHRIKHKFGWQHVILVAKGNDYYLKCLGCGEEEFFDTYRGFPLNERV